MRCPMKYVLVLCDGMADYPVFEDKTPLEFADTPNIDTLAKRSRIGLVRTVPDGFVPGSDVANLGVLGYDVHTCYTGRSPLEAISMGVTLNKDDLAMRANLVTLSDDADFEDKIMLDYGADGIGTDEAQTLIDYINTRLKNERYRLYAGTAYRHCLVVKGAKPHEILTPPHDITGEKIAPYMPQGSLKELLTYLTIRSYELLSEHPVNLARIKAGKRPANALWFWGEGTKPQIDDFYQKYRKSACMISAVDLLNGIAIASGMTTLRVDGATGTVDTDYDAKANACLNALSGGKDFCMIHLEGTDESGHQGNPSEKARAISLIDKKIIGKIVSRLQEQNEDFGLLVMPDHYTPSSIRSHTSEPVPYMMYSSKTLLGQDGEYSEKWANKNGALIENPYDLISEFLSL